MNNYALISCLFGTKYTIVHPSPDNKNCFLFTNNKNIKSEIIDKGWNYIYVNFPLTSDYIESSLQAKYIKFLIFLKDFPEFKKYKILIYSDHKIEIKSNAFNEINLLINKNSNKSIIINKSPQCRNKKKKKIYDEINAAMGQDRYKKNMGLTKKFVNSLISSGKISPNVEICSTGFLIYINRDKIKNLINDVYNKCIEHKQPECQIYWSVFSQKYSNEIKKINWPDIKNISLTTPDINKYKNYYKKQSVIFKNDDNIKIKLINHRFSNRFKKRDNHEIQFRRIHTYLIKNNLINGNIIDLGAWIGDNSIPWALNLKHTIYAIDPSESNINYIEKMAEYNDIFNIKTINKAISNKNEIISTNGNIDHCSFSKNINKNLKLNAVSLDYLHNANIIENIACIHLDVEGFEFSVIKGSEKIINKYNPIITFEQHINVDDYMGLSRYIYKWGYNIYLINEILPGCYPDCRNFIAFPKTLNIDINDIHKKIGSNCILSILNHKNIKFNSIFKATLFGKFMDKNEYNDIRSVQFGEKHIFAIIHKNYTKMVIIDNKMNWLEGKYILGVINISCKYSIINAYLSSVHSVNQNAYNIKNIQKIF